MQLLPHIAPLEFPVGMIGTYENGNVASTNLALTGANVELARQVIRTGQRTGK